LFSPGTPVSSTNTNDCHDITKMLLKVALNIKTLTPKFRSPTYYVCKEKIYFKIQNISLYRIQRDWIKGNAYINPFPNKIDSIITVINKYTHISNIYQIYCNKSRETILPQK